MKTKLFGLMLFFVVVVNAQNDYEFTVFNEPYSDLVGATSLNSGQPFDDPVYTVPIGFTFTAAGNSFDTIYFPENGFGAELNSIINFEMGTSTFIIPLAQDIVSRMDAGGNVSSDISYLTVGTAGSRILKIGWTNVGFFDDSTTEDFMNFQVWIYEGSNALEFRYGVNAINNPLESFEEESGPIVAFAPLFDNNEAVFLADAYILSGDPANPDVLVFSGEEDGNGALIGAIPDGTVYRFTPVILSTQDFSAVTLTLFPNPVINNFSIHSNKSINSVMLTNSLGQIIFQVANQTQNINISEIPAGIYFITIKTDKSELTKRIIKN